MFLNQPGCFCYHEPLADGSWSTLLERMDIRPERCVGAIDTSAHQRSAADLGECTKYVLRRDTADILASLRRRGWTLSLELELEKLQLATQDCIPIYYKWFHDIDYLRSVWASVTDLPFDQERAEYLIEMNVQRTFASVKARYEAHRAC